MTESNNNQPGKRAPEKGPLGTPIPAPVVKPSTPKKPKPKSKAEA